MKSKLVLLGLSTLTFESIAAAPNSVAFTPVPALDDFGLIALAAIVGVVGAFIVRRKNKR